MIQLDVRADISRVQRFYSNLKKSAVPKAAARAINDTLTTIRAEGARAIKRQHPALRISDIKSKMTMKRAYYRNLRGMVATQGRPLSLLLFGARENRRGVTARIGPGGRRVTVYQGRKAFIVDRYGGEVFVRRYPKGRQMRKFRGPSMPGVFRAQGGYMQRIAEQRWRTTFNSRMRYEIERAKR